MNKDNIFITFMYCLLFIIFLGGCQMPVDETKIKVANKIVTPEKTDKRFTAEYHGRFNGGYDNHERAIFIIKDRQTNVEYLAITGCGMTELRSTYDGENWHTEEE